MELETQPSDDDSNGNVARDGDLSTSSQEEDPSLSQPAENENESSDGACISAMGKKKKVTKLTSHVRRLEKSLASKVKYITRLKTQKQELIALNTTRVSTQKTTISNLKNTLLQERTSRAQMKKTLRNEFLDEIKSSKVLEKAATKQATLASRDTDRVRGESAGFEKQIVMLTTRISGYRQNLVDTHREKTELKYANKTLLKQLKSWKSRVENTDGAKLEQQLKIETAKTDRARFEADTRSEKADKRIREIAANHSSKMDLLNEQARLKSKEKAERDRAKIEAAAKKQKLDMSKLDSSVAMFHDSTRMATPNGGAFPGGNQLLQVRNIFYCLLIYL